MMKPKHKRRPGLTLTELLVVIAIVVVVTSILAPVLTSTFEGREVREAARQINAYFQQAQARAKELGRPVGVMIKRTAPGEPFDRETDLDFGFQLMLAEEPPPYKGFSTTSRAQLMTNADGTPTGLATIQDGPTFFKFVAPNDYIRFNMRGPKYRILRSHMGRIQFDVRDTPRVRFAPGNSVPFEVFQRPRSMPVTPLELPTGAGIVMNLSGVGVNPPINSNATGEEDQLDDGSSDRSGATMHPRQKYIGLAEFQRPAVAELRNMPLTIMFNPSGEIDRIYRVMPTPGAERSAVFQQIPPKRPQDKIYLFVGREGVSRWANLLDGSNLWIAIDPHTGLITTAPNSLPLIEPTNSTPSTVEVLNTVASSRQLAATGQSMGGQ